MADSPASRETPTTPADFAILIPVYNEEEILASSVTDLIAELETLGATNYELWLCENGSWDRTREIAAELTGKYEPVKTFSVGEPRSGNYGWALKEGMLRTERAFVFCFEIDFWNTSFIEESFTLFPEYDVVIASKQLATSNDERSLFRKFASNFYNIMLKLVLGFKGTETHGIKAFRREPLLPVINACITDRDVFASEFVIRAERANIPKKELPIAIKELRPQRVNIWKRVPHVLRQVKTLHQSLKQ